MRKSEIVSAINTVTAALKSHGVKDGIVGLLREGGKPEVESRRKLMNSLRGYTLEAHSQFGAGERRIVKIFGLEMLETPQTWFALISQEQQEERLVARTLWHAVQFVEEDLSHINELLTNEGVAAELSAERETDAPSGSAKTLVVLVIEEDGTFSKPARLVDAIESITQFYEAFAILLGYSPDSLAVIGCDSGSDKSFDFLGIAKGIEAVNGLIVSLWDRVVFHREHKLGKQLDLIIKSLPVFETVADLEGKQAIPPEQAEILRRMIIDGAEKFMRAGVTTPAINARARVEPRQLLAPEQKLLIASSDPKDRQEAPPPAPPSSPPQKRRKSKQSTKLEEIVREVVERVQAAEDEED